MASNSNLSLSKEELLLRLEDAEETLRAIRSGEVDAIVVSSPQGDQVFTLKDASHPYQLLIEEMSEGALVLTTEGIILYCNSRFAEISSLPMQNILGESFLQFVIPNLQTKGKEFLEQRPNGNNRGELTLVGNPAEVIVGISLKEIMLDDKLRLCVVISDITERKQAEEALRLKNEEIKVMSQQLWQTAKLAVMGELATTITHELRNPLANISQQAATLLKKLSVEDLDAQSLKAIEAEAKRMSALMENLFNSNQRSYPVISPTNVCEEATKAVDLFQHQFDNHQIQVLKKFPSRTPWVRADRQQLRQVFLNLFRNAVDAMPNGGMLTIHIWEEQGNGNPSAKNLGQRSITRKPGMLTLPPPHVFIEISDTGPGIPEKILNKVWEPFFTTKAAGKGLGLGLGISQRIVLEHSGKIEIMNRDKPHKGTTIRIMLPIGKLDD